jgi:predicted nucleic acid-binding protein
VYTYLLDTSVFCQPIKDRPADVALDRWSQVGDDAVCTSALCLAELLQGLESRGSAKYWNRYNELLASRYEGIPFDNAVAPVYAKLHAELKQLGTPKPVVDLMIAATAKTHGLIVATLNCADFNGIPGVAVEDWSR